MGKNSREGTSVKEKVEAIEYDICTWLEANQGLSYENQRKEIVDGLSGLKLSSQLLLELAAYMLIRMGQAHFVIQREKQFEPLIVSGYKNIISRRANAKLPRRGGRSERIKIIKKILSKAKKNDISFKIMLQNAIDGHMGDLILETIRDGRYRVRTYDFDDWIEVSESTIRDWYTECLQKKIGNSCAKTK